MTTSLHHQSWPVRMALICSLSLFLHVSGVDAIQLKTSTRLPGVSSLKAHAFLSTPSNWPKIVASSYSVQPVQGSSYSRTDSSMAVGDEVDEVFGLPPLLPLSVRWTCERSNSNTGDLAFYSPDGLPNVARDCRMIFAIRDDDDMESRDGCIVDFTMEYQPVSPLATLAMPILEVDNNLAIKGLLPIWCK